MMPFARQPQPGFWAAKEEKWREDLAAAKRAPDPLGWKHENRPLRDWFHALVRRAGEPRLCAYCDTTFEGSRETIDHFQPLEHFPELALAWDNLFPSCDRCNEKYKRLRWSPALVRPDRDPVRELFDIDLVTGRLLPGPRLDLRTQARVRMTVCILGLNDGHRCLGRLRVIKEMAIAARAQEDTLIAERTGQGPYRFVALRAHAGLKDKADAESRPQQ